MAKGAEKRGTAAISLSVRYLRAAYTFAPGFSTALRPQGVKKPVCSEQVFAPGAASAALPKKKAAAANPWLSVTCARRTGLSTACPQLCARRVCKTAAPGWRALPIFQANHALPCRAGTCARHTGLPTAFPQAWAWAMGTNGASGTSRAESCEIARG